MRILLVEFTSAVSGGERSLLELVQGLRGEHELTLACPSGPLADHARELGVEVVTIPASQLTFRLHPRHTLHGLVAMAHAAHRLRAIVRTLRPAVVHANSIRAGLLALPAARDTTPVLVHCRDVLPRGPSGAVVRVAVLAGADRVVAISRHVATSFAGAGWAGRGVTVVENAVDLARFDPAALSTSACRSALGIEDGPVLSVIAQITPWKGQDLAIRVLGELRRRGHTAMLLVVGEAKFVDVATRHDNRAFERQLHALVDSLELGGHVRFLGERSDPERILAATDVLLVPSTEEPFGRTIIEAMATGVPVVATNVGGAPEILDDGIGGRVVPGRDPAAWADAVDELARWSPEQRKAARAVTEARFSRERHTAAILALYAEAVSRRGARRRLGGACLAARHLSKVALDSRVEGTSAVGALRRLWMWQLWRRTVRRAVTIRCADGSLLLTPPWSRMASHVAATGLTERDEAIFVLDLLRPHDLFIDVGANIGFYTVLAARRGARVLALEPSPDAMSACRKNVLLNHLERVVTLRQAACGATEGVVGFSAGLDISNHIVGGDEADLVVELTTLDRELAAEDRTPAMLKVDAEGHDLDVLHGSLRALKRIRPVIMVEVWAGGVDERRLLEPLGYRAYRYRSDDRVLESVSSEFAGQANMLFVCDQHREAVVNRLTTSDRPCLLPPAIRWKARAGSGTCSAS